MFVICIKKNRLLQMLTPISLFFVIIYFLKEFSEVF